MAEIDVTAVAESEARKGELGSLVPEMPKGKNSNL